MCRVCGVSRARGQVRAGGGLRSGDAMAASRRPARNEKGAARRPPLCKLQKALAGSGSAPRTAPLGGDQAARGGEQQPRGRGQGDDSGTEILDTDAAIQLGDDP